jgi:hypothetical protein
MLPKPFQNLKHTGLGRPRQISIVYVLQPKPSRNTGIPFEIVVDTPCPCAGYIYIVV